MKYSSVFHEVCLRSKRRNNYFTAPYKSPGDRRNWNSSVEKMNSLFETSYIDPFDFDSSPRQFVNFATSAVARKDMQDAMTSYIASGKRLATKSVEERLGKS